MHNYSVPLDSTPSTMLRLLDTLKRKGKSSTWPEGPAWCASVIVPSPDSALPLPLQPHWTTSVVHSGRLPPLVKCSAIATPVPSWDTLAPSLAQLIPTNVWGLRVSATTLQLQAPFGLGQTFSYGFFKHHHFSFTAPDISAMSHFA